MRRSKKYILIFLHENPSKGKSQPINIFKPVPEAPKEVVATADRDILVGRKAEAGKIKEMVLQVKVKKSKYLVLESTVGLGKTKLTNYATNLAEKLEMTYFVGTADAIDKNTPLFVFKSIMSQFIEFEESDIAAYVLKSCGKHWLEFLPLLKDCVPSLEVQESSRVKSMSTQQRQNSLCELITIILKSKCSQKPIVFILENLQWMDETSLRLANTILQQVHPISILFTTRPLPKPGEAYSRLRDSLKTLPKEKVDWIKLQKLDDFSILKIAMLRLVIFFDLPEKLEAYVKETSEGNPLFCEEAIDALVTSNKVVVEDTHIICGSLSQVVLPDTIENAINSRIDQIDPSPQMVLKVASVLGTSFSVDVLSRVFPIKEEISNLSKHLDLLIELDFMLPAERNTFKFVSKVVREVAYSRILFDQRIKLHEAVHKYLQSNDSRDPSMGYHYFMVVFLAKNKDPEMIKQAVSYLLESAKVFRLKGDSQKFKSDVHRIQTLFEHDFPEKAQLKREFEMLVKTNVSSSKANLRESRFARKPSAEVPASILHKSADNK